MPRPRKCRRVCQFPEHSEFCPVQNIQKTGRKEMTVSPVILTVDEYETIRLIDREGFSQEQCSRQMQIARTTVQKIYETARRKLADVLVDGLPLKIEGGDYRLCRGAEETCRFSSCCSRFQTNIITVKHKGENAMRIAVTYENGNVFQHFGHTEQFKLYDTEAGKISASRIIATEGTGHSALADFLKNLNTDVLICGGIGGGAKAALTQAGIEICPGVSGAADQAVLDFLSGTLVYQPDTICSHHENGHHEGECAGHGCQNGSCSRTC